MAARRRRRRNILSFLKKRRLLKPLLVGTAVLVIALGTTVGYYYVQFSRLIEARLHGERDRIIPRVFARPLTLNTGQVLSEAELIARLNDVGYAERGTVDAAGEFATEAHTVSLIPRGGAFGGKSLAVAFALPPTAKPGAKAAVAPSRIAKITVDGTPVAAVALDPPLLTGLATGSREKRRRVALDAIPVAMQHAVLAIEDRRFYYHPGVDPIRMVGALVTNIAGRRSYLVGASTITQQLARNFFLVDEMAAEQQARQRSWRRKVLEQFMAVILETKATKNEILELYLNDVYLGNRGSFALHGVAEAARIFFGKAVTNLTLSEAALIAGVIQSPYNHSPFGDAAKATERRNVVLRAMADASYISSAAATTASKDPVTVVSRAVDNEAPYFVDYLGQVLDAHYPGITTQATALDVYTTLDLNLQRAAQDAVRDGLAKVDATLARRHRGKAGPAPRAQAAMVAVDPRSGDILALVGGRSYNQSQFNRAVNAHRQPGSTFKPFVFLSAFEHAAADGLAEPTPATLVRDEPTTWTDNGEEWAPRNYENEYDGQITLRRALALSRNIATIKIAEQAGFDRVAALWRKTKVGGADLKGYPSIALGVFELSPLELATAYTLFPNGGTISPLRALAEVVSGGKSLKPPMVKGPAVARPDTTFLVTSMLRSVIGEGTAAGVRAAGFALDAAGKTGTTNDLRDAWFVGFTPELLAVVWVGLDDNQPLGLSGSNTAVPIWTSFMLKALAGHPNVPFEVPPGVTFVEIDRDTGKLATPNCPRVVQEAFLAGTEPLEVCDLHRF